MNYIKLYTEEYDPGVTLVSNVFIDYFLKDANDAQVKIYLYLIRHISNHKPFTISNIADEFNHTEKDVIRALSYWEQKQVLSLEYDGSDNIIGIEFHELNEDMFKPNAQLQVFPITSIHGEAGSNADSSKSHTFTASELHEIAKDSDWDSIKSIAENYLGKTLSSADVQSLAHIYKDLSFTPSEVDRLFEECLSNGKTVMRSIKKYADEKYMTANVSSSVTAVMNALGETSVPTADELDYINRWLREMNLELVLEGCKKATLATNTNRFKYAEGIFRNWRAQGIKSIEDMAASEEMFKKNRENQKTIPFKNDEQAKKPAVRKEAVNKFGHYQRTYDFEELEREFRVN